MNARLPIRPWLIVLLIVLGTLGAMAGFALYATWASRSHIEDKQRVVLFQTDHAALQRACRDVWENRKQYGRDEGSFVRIDPDSRKLPSEIRSLEPQWIFASSSGLNIELGGQWCHYGFEADFGDLKADDARMLWRNAFPSEQLSEGFWYYAENGVVPPRR